MKQDPTLKSDISVPIQNRTTGTWTIYLVRRVSRADGESLGSSSARSGCGISRTFYRAISLGADSSIAMVRLDGVTLTRFPRTDTIGKTYSNSQHLLPDGVSGAVREPNPINGRMTIKAAHRLASYPLFALATKTEEAALANWRAMAQLMSLAVLGGAIAIAVAAFAFGRQSKQHALLDDAQAEIRRQDDLTAAFEEMRVAKEDAEMANRAKSEFLANMSHELAISLNAVLGFSEMLVNETFGPLGDEHYRDYAKDIHASGSHLLGIINDILDLSKAASGKLALLEEWVDAREVVNSVCRLIQPRVGEGKLLLYVTMPPGDLILYADERLLRQMLLNLLSNACKFTPHNGHIDCSDRLTPQA